jgi:repressor LexA
VNPVPLTRRQHEILAFYRGFTAEHGYSPTLEEVAQHFGVNKVTIFGHVAELERKGALQRSAKHVSRGLVVVDNDASASSSSNGNGPREFPESSLPVASVPILGRIAAGVPIETIESPEPLAWSDIVPSDRDVYALRVRGHSMIDDGIHDGDVVLVERRSNVVDGDMVVAVLPEEEATLKRIYREKHGFRLQPANMALKPIFAPHVEVRGVVIGVVRRY